jgi:1,4-dihydroxy-2-naphthoyl-CoA hydrolase
MWEREGVVRLSHTDAAGVMFFPRLLELAHEGWEDFLAEGGLPLARGLAGPVHLPIVHCEADYRRPMRLGDRFVARLLLEREGERSCAIRHRFLSPAGELLAEALTVHAALDRATGASVSLSAGFRELLSRLRDSAAAPGGD